MDTLDRIYEMMYCELDDIAKKEKLDSKDVELIDKFVDIIKDIDEIGMNQDMGIYSMANGGSYGNGSSYSNGGSFTGGSYARGRSGRMMPYGRGSSYARGRSNNNGYSRDESKDMMLNQLQEVMDMAVDEKDRKAVERLMSQMAQN